MGFWYAGEYVLFRDGHACHGRKGCKNHMLSVHRIESRKTGGGAPNNPAALCGDCHSGYRDAHGHPAGKLKLNLKRGQSFRDAAFMGIMRRAFYNRLKEEHPNAGTAYGYTAKNRVFQLNRAIQ
ncbi:MAG: hypothetical protein LBU32_17940 [Clostridiales bacterium]|jgi:N6-L-threonylcarbamoyladenine synthase|nr:hypothetical protein [Clostridiales bacterium]